MWLLAMLQNLGDHRVVTHALCTILSLLQQTVTCQFHRSCPQAPKQAETKVWCKCEPHQKSGPNISHIMPGSYTPSSESLPPSQPASQPQPKSSS